MRRRWLANLALYIPAFVIAFVIWLIAKQGDTETRTVSAKVELVGVPENVEARVGPTSSVEVNLIFPKAFLKNVLEPERIKVALKPEGIESKAGVGTYRSIPYPVLPGMVEMGDLPPSVRVLGVVPETVSVEARLVTVEAEVKPQITGSPDPGYEIESVRATPAKIELTGSPKVLKDKLGDTDHPEVDTAKVSIDGAKSSVSVTAELDLPPGVRGVDAQSSPPRVEVTVSIREKIATRVFKDVLIKYEALQTALDVIVQPPTVTVTVKGPRSKVDQLDRDSFRFMPNATPNEAPGARNKVSFRMYLRPEKESLADDLEIDTDVRTVTLMFEEKSRSGAAGPTGTVGPSTRESVSPAPPPTPKAVPESAPLPRDSDTPSSPGAPKPSARTGEQ